MGFFLVIKLEKEPLMLKREIKYKDFNGNEQTEVFHFNISRQELMEMLVEPDEGLDKWLEKILATKDNRALLAQFKKIILSSYGEKSEDGKRFVKTDEIREVFAQTAAYDALFTDLTTNEASAADFIKGIVPEDMAEMAEAAEAKKAADLIAAAQAVADANKTP